MTTKVYDDCFDSGISWIGKIPSHWKLVRAKNLIFERQNATDSSLPCGAISFGRVVEKDSESIPVETRKTYQEIHEGEYLVNPINLNYDLKSLRTAISEIDVCVSPAYIIAKANDEVLHPKYGHYLLHVFDLFQMKRLGEGVRQTIRFADIGACFLCAPTLQEQASIASVLDHEATKIDALIEEQQRLMELLHEKRHAVISQAVSKGLDQNAPMSDSGVDWLGKVPAHWKVRQIRSVCTFLTSGPRGWSDSISDVGSIFVQSGDLDDRMNVDFAEAKRVSVEEDAETARTRLADGDVVVCITGAKTGNVAVCEVVPERAYVNQHLCLVRPSEEVVPSFLAMQLKSKVGQTYFDLSQYGLKQGLSLQNVKSAPVLLPPIDEQRLIIERVKMQIEEIDSLAALAQKAVDLLAERRSALISAAVTGKIDVRAWRNQEELEPA